MVLTSTTLVVAVVVRLVMGASEVLVVLVVVRLLVISAGAPFAKVVRVVVVAGLMSVMFVFVTLKNLVNVTVVRVVDVVEFVDVQDVMVVVVVVTSTKAANATAVLNKAVYPESVGGPNQTVLPNRSLRVPDSAPQTTILPLRLNAAKPRSLPAMLVWPLSPGAAYE